MWRVHSDRYQGGASAEPLLSRPHQTLAVTDGCLDRALAPVFFSKEPAYSYSDDRTIQDAANLLIEFIMEENNEDSWDIKEVEIHLKSAELIQELNKILSTQSETELKNALKHRSLVHLSLISRYLPQLEAHFPVTLTFRALEERAKTAKALVLKALEDDKKIELANVALICIFLLAFIGLTVAAGLANKDDPSGITSLSILASCSGAIILCLSCYTFIMAYTTRAQITATINDISSRDVIDFYFIASWMQTNAEQSKLCRKWNVGISTIWVNQALGETLTHNPLSADAVTIGMGRPQAAEAAGTGLAM